MKVGEISSVERKVALSTPMGSLIPRVTIQWSMLAIILFLFFLSNFSTAYSKRLEDSLMNFTLPSGATIALDQRGQQRRR
eukprot:c47271_g1_i1 orf=85-324(+)